MKKNTITQTIHTEPAHVFREVICPFCNHKFMTYMSEFVDGTFYIQKETNERIGQRNVCPMCSETFAMLNGVLEGKAEDELPEDVVLRREFPI